MEAGQEPGAIERAVIAAERRVYRKRPWYMHRTTWGTTGALIGFVAGVFWQQILNPDHVQAKSVEQASAPQQMVAESELKPAVPKVEAPALAKKEPDAQKDAKSPIVPANLEYPALPPAKELSGELRGMPQLPAVELAPVEPVLPVVEKPMSKKADPEADLKAAKAKVLSERIAQMKLDREELLKTYYEDAIPIKHLNEDIAAAEAELKTLQK